MSLYLSKYTDSTQTFKISDLAEDYGMSGTKLNQLLHRFGIQFKHNGVWNLYTKYSKEGFVISRNLQLNKVNGINKTVKKRLWTQKGRKFIYETLKDNGHLPLLEKEDQT